MADCEKIVTSPKRTRAWAVVGYDRRHKIQVRDLRPSLRDAFNTREFLDHQEALNGPHRIIPVEIRTIGPAISEKQLCRSRSIR